MKVKIKHVFAGICMLALNFFANAQDSVTFRQKIHHQFAPLKSSTRINTGYLYDKANADLNVYNFTGSSGADTATAGKLRQLVWQQENAYLPSDKDASVELSKMDSIANYYIVNNYHPLTIILSKYNEFLPEALDSGWIGFNNDSQLVETSQYSPNPYREFNVFAAEK